MADPAPRAARLQAIKNRWFSDPLSTDLPPLSDETIQVQPKNCDEFVRSTRLAAAFSALHEAPEAVGMTPEQALVHDRQVNAQRFGVEDPRSLLEELSRQFDSAPTGRVNPEILKKGYVLLDKVRASSLHLAAQCTDQSEATGFLHASYLADAQALSQAQGLIVQLTSELGISLPLRRGGRQRG